MFSSCSEISIPAIKQLYDPIHWLQKQDCQETSKTLWLIWDWLSWIILGNLLNCTFGRHALSISLDLSRSGSLMGNQMSYKSVEWLQMDFPIDILPPSQRHMTMTKWMSEWASEWMIKRATEWASDCEWAIEWLREWVKVSKLVSKRVSDGLTDELSWLNGLGFLATSRQDFLYLLSNHSNPQWH